LIGRGADVNMADDHGNTPLIISADHRNIEFTILLLEQPNINVDAVDINGQTALSTALSFRGMRVLPEQVELLLDSGANPNIATKYTTLLGLAARHIDLVNLLLAHGADPNFTSENGDTPLMYAVMTGTLEVVRRLLEIPNLDIDAASNDNQTALKSAVLRRETGYEKVKLLLEAGADPNTIPANTISNMFKPTYDLLREAKQIWLANQIRADQDLTKKFIIARRLRQNQTLPQRELSDGLIRKAEYDNLCVGLQSNLNKPGVIALAKSLKIKTTGQTKNQLCKEIAGKLII
jgi:hypothetical protein